MSDDLIEQAELGRTPLIHRHRNANPGVRGGEAQLPIAKANEVALHLGLLRPIRILRLTGENLTLAI
jgi:hypothetical protein